MQNNETKWEERFKDFYWEQGEYKDRKLGFDEYKSFISQEIEKSYQKGRNEMSEIGLETTLLGLRLTKKVEKRTRLQTLEEVERILQKELETWAKESIGAKAVESIILAIKEYEQNK